MEFTESSVGRIGKDTSHEWIVSVTSCPIVDPPQAIENPDWSSSISVGSLIKGILTNFFLRGM